MIKKLILIIFIFSFGQLTESQINYNNKKFLKEVNQWSNGGVAEAIPSNDKNTLHGRFFTIKKDFELKGYAFVGRVNSCRSQGCSIAPSSEEDSFEFFDYFSIFDLDGKISEIVIYDYQATHGEEVTSKNWLQQFVGYNGSVNLEVGKNIDAISGATTSTYSLVENVKQVAEQFKDAVGRK
jgi:hypothetical protein